MSNNWYYMKSGQRLGPVTEDRLRQLAAAGEVGLSDLLWREGMAQRAPAQAVPWLFASPQGASAPPRRCRPYGAR